MQSARKTVEQLLGEIPDNDPLFLQQLSKTSSVESIVEQAPSASRIQRCKDYLEQRYKLLKLLESQEADLLDVMKWRKEEWKKALKQGSEATNGPLWDISNYDIQKFIDSFAQKVCLIKLVQISVKSTNNSGECRS